jgi:hypothetical protein
MSEKILKFEGSLFPDAKLMIQESKRLGNGIFAWKTPNGIIYTRMLDFETIIRFKGRFIWEIINPEEMKRLHFTQESIAIQESFIEKQTGKKHTKYIEESASEIENATEEELLEKARRESKEWIEKQKRENAEKESGHVTINLIGSKPEKEKLENVENPSEITKEDVDTAKEIIDTGFEKLQEKYPQLPEDYRPKNLKGLQKLKDMLEEPKKQNIPSGTIPLSLEDAGYGEPEKQYESFESLLEDLHRQEKHGTVEEKAFSKAVIDELVKKSVRQILRNEPISDEDVKKEKFELKPKKTKKIRGYSG